MGSDGKPRPRLSTPLICLALAMVPGIYLALIVSSLTALAIGAGIVYGCYWLINLLDSFLGESPLGPARMVLVLGMVVVPLTIGVLIGIGSGVWGFFKSFRRQRFPVGGIRVQWGDHLELEKEINEICDLLGTRAPTNVVLTLDATAFVTGSPVQLLFEKIRGRTLAIGLPYFGVLTVSEFRSLLSHELAHFSGRDTLYTNVIQPVYEGALNAMSGMSLAFRDRAPRDEEEVAYDSWVQLPVMFSLSILLAYLWIFKRINSAISRQREFRADALSAEVSGSEVFRIALKKIIAASIFFDMTTPDWIKKYAYKDRTDLVGLNLYESFRIKLSKERDTVRNILESEVQAGDDAWSSHPSLSRRLEHLPEEATGARDNRSAKVLLKDPDKFERVFTKYFLGRQ